MTSTIAVTVKGDSVVIAYFRPAVVDTLIVTDTLWRLVENVNDSTVIGVTITDTVTIHTPVIIYDTTLVTEYIEVPVHDTTTVTEYLYDTITETDTLWILPRKEPIPKIGPPNGAACRQPRLLLGEANVKNFYNTKIMCTFAIMIMKS